MKHGSRRANLPALKPRRECACADRSTKTRNAAARRHYAPAVSAQQLRRLGLRTHSGRVSTRPACSSVPCVRAQCPGDMTRGRDAARSFRYLWTVVSPHTGIRHERVDLRKHAARIALDREENGPLDVILSSDVASTALGGAGRGRRVAGGHAVNQ